MRYSQEDWGGMPEWTESLQSEMGAEPEVWTVVERAAARRGGRA